ncbi:DUF397 domain-containing protein [Streptomyces sp. NPDC094437]|uniref:DUF397 domain-containing protein n=1 Tax=Streptomyces sp. NPDC094437 TaxID=3366060 RepID=UPI00380644FA
MSNAELHWFKSSYSSSGEAGDCVEVANTPVAIHVRDSKNPAHGNFAVSRATWVDFLTFADVNA